MSSEIYLQELETFFLALADKTRLRLLNLMRDEEICVCFFTEVLGESQPKISRHLAYLRNAGLVEARRDGKWMHYRIIEPENEVAKRVLRETLDGLKERDEMRQDYEKLFVACCGVSVPVTISRAPKPDTFVQPNMNYEREELDTFLL
ncbi:MAG TPA: metalloregulator ArsR/SmtB family transcription factor [Pyrinomonadaceae bacterium]|nr:metalloregulator ArsR/SmtB family transcription factor [Pyrinomonadaceae bacterium]